MNVLAIDPGMSGAAVLFRDGELSAARDFKHVEDIGRAIAEFGPQAHVAIIEMVAARPGQGVTSMFNFGYATGYATGCLHGQGFSVFDTTKRLLVEVPPQRWIKYYLETFSHADSFDSKNLVRQLWPRWVPFVSREKDHNTADAILLGAWYILNPDAKTSLRARDKKRVKMLRKRFNPVPEKT